MNQAFKWVIGCSLTCISSSALADRALVIGINEYLVHEDIPPLRGAVYDADNIAKLLIDEFGFQQEDILILRNKEATRSAILGGLDNWLVGGTAPGERAFFYYAGHGFEQRSDSAGAEEGYDQTLVPVDTDIEISGRIVNMITDKDLKAAFAKLKDRRATAVFDSCFSGTVTRSIGGSPQDMSRTPFALMNRGRAATSRSGGLPDHRGKTTLLDRSDHLAVWSAVTAYQVALEDDEDGQPQGAFTKRFVNGIRSREADANHDGKITHTELLDFVQLGSDSFCKSKRPKCPAGLLPTLEVARRLQVQPIGTSMGEDVPSDIDVQTSASQLFNPESGVLSAGSWIRWTAAPEGGRFKLGANMQVNLHSGIRGYLTLFDINAEGVLTQLFPNQGSARAPAMLPGEGPVEPGFDRRIGKGETLKIPVPMHGFDLVAEKPLGRGQIVAVITDQPVDFGANADASRGAKPVANREKALDYIATIGQLLREPWTADSADIPDKRVGWAIAIADYNIVE